MSNNAEKNVVNLDEYGQMRRSQEHGAGKKALQDILALSSKSLTNQLQRMLEKVDDALFARAEMAESNYIQTLYFDAMRELRIIRKDIEEDFLDRFTSQFMHGVPRQSAAGGNFSLNWEDDSSEAGLVDRNDLEEDLAVANMVNRIRGTCTQSLYALDKRIGFLLNDPDLETWHNPLGPEAVCDAFRAAARRIETGPEIRLVVFKMFDQYIASHMDALYRDINQHLARLGVLPEIKATLRRPAEVQLPPPDAPGHAAQTCSVMDAADSGSTSGTGLTGACPPDMAGDGKPATTPISTLTLLQHGTLPAQPVIVALDGIDMGELTSGTVNVLHGIKQSPLIQDMGKTGDMTIGIVAMLFDYILDDKNIPAAMRALIGRLQIPVLKVALLDREFFSRKSHPARQLLNRLADTAVGWDESQGEEDPLYMKTQAIVQTVLDGFEDDVSLFAQLLDDFETFLDASEQEARLRAERSAKAMEGQERLQVAKSTTLDEIEPRIADQEGTDFVREFITTHWKNLLFITCARDGKDSEAWRHAVKIMDDLIWSVKPKFTPEDRGRLVAIQPKLLEGLRKGMERLSVVPTERDDFIARLVRAHGRTAIKPDASPQRTQQRSGTGQKVPQPTARREAARSTPRGSHTPRPVEDRYTARVRHLKSGDWIELVGSDGLTKRAKLSWISPITGSFLFTDRQGLKVANHTLEEIAGLLRAGRARILNAAPLMDRAVTTVLQEYRKS